MDVDSHSINRERSNYWKSIFSMILRCAMELFSLLIQPTIKPKENQYICQVTCVKAEEKS
jgi:hypothetical protein